ncbi:MAG: hypothetical protein JGK17_14430 [Microcoleus sp. PH2017_10_PVI_O_A]|uniref:hypothetical protein n=1 Tax=unclassified Microcoleus TaxID=2642155 RepID=UPI001D46D882|nr:MULTISPECIES: hypothetical protein [unclassified Microcoleus]TAF19804.1 MAG: hypothetical protein EAZ73_14040 [Oscillatoriales cyanobacterium]MCC3406759.1 hypothetical protein [Microcoleus sp. PH2017_10_PVI_O_A]MCC3460895.1 hypothetical protein [Microcoleus sp. PH2017_11_PCY_U_A]MCC3479416.1 hypothetical protein [Microcoleus sp. PH2017_12_PCY_D_A]MCC3529345.1 hypothetical protein [Microcoleus sp. PH2017_21_RUC_O_A]
MNILIANIGTSDLTIQISIEGENYYLPIDYLSNEANIGEKIAKLKPNLQKLWDYKTQRNYIETILYPEFGFPTNVKQTSRKLTQIVWEKYQANEIIWHPRIKPARIWGVIQKAISLGATKGYIFVTNQVTFQNPEGHEKDTIYMYDILVKWLELENIPFKIERKFIDSTIDANRLEPLLSDYEKHLKEIANVEKLNLLSAELQPKNDLVMASIKGGTGTMVTALQIKAIDSNFKILVFIDPELNLENILQGKPSECTLTLYWRHLRSQKYDTVRQLLLRWDFDGAILILDGWQKNLDLLPSGIIDETNIEASKVAIKSAIAALNLGLSFINLDRAETKNILKFNPAISVLSELEKTYEPWLNLYAQCRIYWELNQVANFLSRLTSFYEELLSYLIIELGGSKYFAGDIYNWQLQKSLFEPELWDKFYQYASKKNSKFKKYDFDNQKYWLTNRWEKFKLVAILVDSQETDNPNWKYIKESLPMLEYWIKKRNKMIHLAKGVSKTTMWEMLELDRKSEDKQIKNEAIQACNPDEILQVTSEICSRAFKLLGLEEKSFVGYSSTTPYYLYSEIIDWVLRHLETDKLR